MKRILFINACVRPQSRTLILAKELLGRLSGEAEEVNLEREGIAPLNWETLQLRDGLAAQNDFTHDTFRYARQFAAAEEIVIAAPYWDLSFPATVRTYIEAVSVVGLTFHYTTEDCPEGLCKAQKLHYVTTAGGAVGQYNLGYDYIKAIANTFFGIQETFCYSAEELDMAGADVRAIMNNTIVKI